MKTYISILRGINVGSHKRIKMDLLRKMYENLGYKNIQIYIQSGNIIFQDQEQKIQLIKDRIEQQILQEFGFEVPVILIEQPTLAEIINNNPYGMESDLAPLYVTLLSSIPEQKNLNKITPNNYLPDQYTLSRHAIYLYCAQGYGNTKLTNNFFESKLKVTASTRNWKTLLQLYAMVCDISQ